MNIVLDLVEDFYREVIAQSVMQISACGDRPASPAILVAILQYTTDCSNTGSVLETTVTLVPILQTKVTWCNMLHTVTCTMLQTADWYCAACCSNTYWYTHSQPVNFLLVVRGYYYSSFPQFSK